MNIEFSNSSMLQSPIVVDTEAQTAVLTYNNGKEYTYPVMILSSAICKRPLTTKVL